jgi:pimeloyl-ACP methyl ester carboxylesterase
MTQLVRNHLTDLRGVSRMAVDAAVGITGLVGAMHAKIAKGPTKLAGATVGTAVNRAISAVYQSIGGVTRAVGGGIDLALGAVAPALGSVESSSTRESVIAALSGVLGDYLAETGNPLGVTMCLRREGKPLELERDRLAAAIRAPSSKVLILVHGLCRNDRSWERNGHDHGAELARDLSYTAVYLHYNTGLHVSTNGRAFAEMLEDLVAAWPVPVKEVSILAHSMGGLVARSACHYASAASHAWLRRLRKLVFLGTPHHGTPLERAGHRVDLFLESISYTAPFAVLGKLRSAGITDLRHGYVLDEDWKGRDRFANRTDPHCAVPLPKRIQCYTIAGSIGRKRSTRRTELIGDGLVPIASALGDHRDSRRRLAFPSSHRWTAWGTSHLGLLRSDRVYERIRGWFEE